MFERKKQKLASTRVFFLRIIKTLCVSLVIISISLLIGILGYHYFAGIEWLDSLHNASMILSGMGPVVEIKTNSGKWFSSIYALFSGIVFIGNIGVILAPVAHRLFHRLILEG